LYFTVLSTGWLGRFVYAAKTDIWIFATGAAVDLLIPMAITTYYTLRDAHVNITERLKGE
jgi:hypothetical protein